MLETTCHQVLTPASCKRMLKHILEALRFLVSRGVLHRDIKSSNVLLSDGIAKVCDFGLARSAVRLEDFQVMKKSSVAESTLIRIGSELVDLESEGDIGRGKCVLYTYQE